jgi:hypothetical protein
MAGRPVVPTVAAYGQVMVGFDEARLEAMLEDVHERARAYRERDAEEQEQLRAGEIGVEQTLRELEAVLNPQSVRNIEGGDTEGDTEGRSRGQSGPRKT